MPPAPIQLEVCIASLDDAIAAVSGGADRVELNSGLALGGLTPSAGLIAEVVSRIELPVLAMIRPRPGGFAYSASDIEVMCRDVELAFEYGAAGVAFGVLRPNGEIDVARCRTLLEMSAGRPAVFHRAFDVTPDPFAALDALIELGFARVMTSGQAKSALEGSSLIGELIRRAAGRIEVLPAGGINLATVREVIARTGCDQVHASLRKTFVDSSVAARPDVSFGSATMGVEDRFDGTDESAVRALRALLSVHQAG